jgi:hypothetical protein
MSDNFNYDRRPLEENGMSIERQAAAEILSMAGVTLSGTAYYEVEDAATELIIDVVERYIQDRQKEVAADG